jgi:hypothetical protein
MEEYFDSELTYVQAWNRLERSQLDDNGADMATQTGRIAELEVVKKREEDEAVALRNRVDRLPKSPDGERRTQGSSENEDSDRRHFGRD